MSSSFIRVAAVLLLVPVFTVITAAAENYAVFKSTDRGRSWIRSDIGMHAGSRINAFGSLDGTLFAGTDSGIFISRDEARSWRPATGMASGRILSFATLERKVFAGTDGSGMLVSADEGKSWAPTAASPSKKLRCLLAHRDRVYAGTDAEGVFVSGDGGETWTALNREFPEHAQVFALVVAADRLFAALYSKGLYAWNEQEQRWRKAGSVLPLVLAGSADTLIAGHNPGGLHWSADVGVSWSKAMAVLSGQLAPVLPNEAAELSNEVPVWELASNDGMAFAGASNGIYFSEDRGRTWVRARTGLPAESPGISFLLKERFVLAGALIKNVDGKPDSTEKQSQPFFPEPK
ncbi:MAG: hypothetical protein V4710_00405 [Verrucomicrobiota bacterium]